MILYFKIVPGTNEIEKFFYSDTLPKFDHEIIYRYYFDYSPLPYCFYNDWFNRLV